MSLDKSLIFPRPQFMLENEKITIPIYLGFLKGDKMRRSILYEGIETIKSVQLNY